METNNEFKKESLILLIILCLIVSLFWFSTIPIMNWLTCSWTIKGQVGDMFGSVNALFTGLAFAGLIYTIYLQRKDLALQRHELIATRKELERSASAQEKSEIAQSKQVYMQYLISKLTSLNILMNYNTEKADRERRYNAQLYQTLMNDNERYSVEIESLLSQIEKLISEQKR